MYRVVLFLGFVLLGSKGRSASKPSVNFATPRKRAKRAVPPPPSPPPLTRAPGGWISQGKNQAALVGDTMFNSEDLMQVSAWWMRWRIGLRKLSGAVCLQFVYRWWACFVCLFFAFVDL